MDYWVRSIYVDLLKHRCRPTSCEVNPITNHCAIIARMPHYTFSFIAGITINDLDHYSMTEAKYYLKPQ